ncbi:transporter substrate-binding domain-containing protein [Butyrivibrio sp. AC2005]|uniref:transporter substrate-binding domain-containing protein n=1 Tax=Butyrivibrio sp. AC2005 TaxID=1280672 RepID=UPI000413EFD2|nr:transporter substrate-binding domain-containing protein [Butyrivibrio sp. AC2005]
MKKKMLALVMSCVMVVAAGCGSSAGKTDESKADAEQATSTETAAETETEAEPASDASGKVWKIATDTSFKPFEYTDDSGNFVGIDMDILDAVAKDQGFAYEVQVLGWDASIAACQAGQADGMIAGASITDERKESGWIFSDGYYDANQSMAVETSSDITGFDGLNGKSVAVKTGTMSASYAESLSEEYGFTVTYFEDSPTMYQAVVGGQVAATFDDTPIMAANIKDTGIAMKIVDGTGNEPAAYGFAIFNADNQELVDMFNKGLANIKANGTYDEIIKKYLGE